MLEKSSNLCKYQKNPGEYRKSDRIWASTRNVIEFGQVPEKGLSDYRKSDSIWASTRRIRASTGKLIEFGQEK